jgi:hypothetical protein
VGSVRDEALAECYQMKRKQVFFAENSPESVGWCSIFHGIAHELGLAAISYGGAAGSLRPAKLGLASTIDDEMRDEFYPSQIIVVYFGHPKTNGRYEDHWVLQESYPLRDSRRDVVVYASEDFPIEVLRQHNIGIRPRIIRTVEDFKANLRRDLAKITARLSGSAGRKRRRLPQFA